MTADHARWAPVLPALEKHFTVYACDRRGRGASGDAPDYAIENEFDDVAAVVDSIGGPVDLVGHSYGAICALEASARTKNLRRLVLYEPPLPTGAPMYPAGLIERLQATLDAGDREGVVATALSEAALVPPKQLALMKAAPAWKSRVVAAHTIVRELRAHSGYTFDAARFRDVRTPTLLLLGGASPPLVKAATDRVHQAVPSSRVVVLPDQQHVAMDTAPGLFTSEVVKFLED
jgi:pimeloyl-ACP methyl ester carboxylesterase